MIPCSSVAPRRIDDVHVDAVSKDETQTFGIGRAVVKFGMLAVGCMVARALKGADISLSQRGSVEGQLSFLRHSFTISGSPPKALPQRRSATVFSFESRLRRAFAEATSRWRTECSWVLDVPHAWRVIFSSGRHAFFRRRDGRESPTRRPQRKGRRRDREECAPSRIRRRLRPARAVVLS